MIVKSFLDWYGTAPLNERIEAVRMMSQVYLSGDLGSDTPREAEAALTLVLDDHSISVRAALAWEMASSAKAPRTLVVGLAHDEAEVAAIVLARSPLMTEADLIDCAKHGEALSHLAIAMRDEVTERVASALVAVAGPRTITALLANAGAHLSDEMFRTILNRHGDDAALREALNRRHDLPADVRQSLVALVSQALLGMIREKGWAGQRRIERPVCEARDHATIELAAEAPDLMVFVGHLARSEQLTPSLLIRSLMCGDRSLFGAALVCLSGVSANRIAGMLTSRPGSVFSATCVRAGLPRSMTPVFAAAIQAINERKDVIDAHETPKLQRGIIERVTAACALENPEDMRPVFAMLRRFEAEVARSEARVEIENLRAHVVPNVVVNLDALEADLLSATAEITVQATESAAVANDTPDVPAGAKNAHTGAGLFSIFKRKPQPKDRALPADLEALLNDVVETETIVTPALTVVDDREKALDGDYFAAPQEPVQPAAVAA